MTTMIDALLGTFGIFFFNAVLAVAFTGMGLTLRRAFGLMQATLEDCFLAFWMGFGLVILFLMLWNFALPVGPTALAIVLVAGIAGMAAARRLVTTALRELPPSRWSVIGAVLFSLWIANLSLGQPTYWDSALYHMQGVKWASSYPVVPGLANVFGPMGFNNSSFLYNAMLDAGPWAGRAWRVSNGLLVSAFGVQLIMSTARLLGRRTPASSIHVFPLLLLPAAVNSALDGRVASFATVVPVSMVLMVTAIRGYLALTDKERPDRERAYDFFCIVGLAAIAVSIKTSAAVFAAAILAVSCYGVLGLGRASGGLRGRALVWSLTAVTVIGITWATRGIVLSGYPLFPSQVLGLAVDWRVPAEHARAEFDFVVHNSRATTWNVAFMSGNAEGLGVWLPHWVRTAFDDLYDIVVPAGLAAISTLALLLSSRRATARQWVTVRPGWLLLAPLGVALAAWFAVAPMPRYGTPFFWALAALVGSQAFRLRPRSAALTRRVVAAGCLLGVTPCLVNPMWSSLQSPSGRGVFARILDSNLKLPDPGHWYQAGEPQPQLRVYTTQTGLVLNVPVGQFGRCWDAPLPCTPNPAPTLRLRVPGHIERGFAVDGDWQMLDWPEPWRPELLPAIREAWRKRDGSALAR